MCYDDDARPPIPVGEPGSAKGIELVLTASDGNRFAAFEAIPAKPSGAQVVIYPDIRGLHQFYKELALRFAEHGITALAIDYFGRTAGLTDRTDSFEFMPHVQALQITSFSLDVHAGLDYLRKQHGVQPVFVMGFCMGGALTLVTGTNASFGFTGLLPFYACMSRNFGGAGTVLDIAEKVVYPVLGQFGGADQGIPEAQTTLLDEKLDVANVEHQIIVYPGAPHSFFDRRAVEFAEASAQAWERVLAFISAHSKQTVAP